MANNLSKTIRDNLVWDTNNDPYEWIDKILRTYIRSVHWWSHMNFDPTKFVDDRILICNAGSTICTTNSVNKSDIINELCELNDDFKKINNSSFMVPKCVYFPNKTQPTIKIIVITMDDILRYIKKYH